MASIKSCLLVGKEEIKIIQAFILSKLKSGETNPQKILGDFWNMLTDQKLNYASKMNWMSSMFRVFGPMIPTYGLSSDSKKSSLVKGMSSDQLTEIFNAMDELDNIEDYVQKNFIDPFLPAKGKEEAEDSDNPDEGSNLAKDTDPENSLEQEEETKEKEALDDSLEDLIDEFGDNQEIEDDSDFDFEDLNIIQDTDSRKAILINRAIRQKYIAVDHNGFFRTFTYNKDTDQFTEVSSDVSRSDIGAEPMSTDDFINEFKGTRMVLNHVFRLNITAERENTHDSLLARFAKVASDFWDNKVATLFSNSLNKDDRKKDYFTINEKGELVLGELAKVMSKRNELIRKKLLPDLQKAPITLDLQRIEYYFGKGSKLVLKRFEDPTMEQEQLVLTVQKGKEEVMVLGNFFDTQSLSMFQKTANGSAYLNFITDQLKNAGAEGIDVTDMGIVLERAFMPNFKSAEENRIYRNDQDRYGKDSDVEKAEKLNMTQSRKLLEGMGYRVSRPYIDKGISGSNNNGGAFIAISPFHTQSKIESIVQEAFSNPSTVDFAALNKKHNITFIHLRRKNLGLKDYLNLTKNNKTLRTFEGSEDKNPLLFRDTEKIQAMFNYGQSAPLHYRLASSIEYMEELNRKNPSEELANQILLLKIYLFNDNDFYSNEARTIARGIEWKETFVKSLKEGKPVIHSSRLEQVERAYSNWKSQAGQRNENGQSLQYEDSKFFASRLFGYMPAKVESALDRQIIDKKRKFAKSMANGDQVVENQRLRKGGIFGNTVMETLNVLRDPAIQSIKIKGKTLEEIWDSDSSNTGGIEIQGDIPRPTFNPVVSNKNSRQAYKGFNISSIAELKDSYDGNDLTENYLELEYMPQMPHLVINAGNLVPKTADNSEVKPSARRRALLNNIGKNRHKTVQETFEREYDLPQEMVEQVYEQLLGELQGELIFMDSPIETNEGLIVGQVGKDVLKLHTYMGKVSEAYLRHEIMHRLVNEILSPQTRRALYQAAKTRLLAESNQWTSIDQISDEIADEFLAENYERSFGSYRNSTVAKLPRIIQDFYYFLKRMFDSFRGNRGLIELVSEQLESGYFVNAALNYDGYASGVANKMIKSVRELAENVHPNLQRGVKITRSLIQDFVTSVQMMMYGETAFIDITEDFGAAKLTFREGIMEYKSEMNWILNSLMNPSDVNFVGHEFKNKIWGPEPFESSSANIAKVDEALKLMAENIDSFTDQQYAVYTYVKSLSNFNELAKHAFPFVNISETNGAIDEEGNASGAEKEVEETAGDTKINGENETVSSTARHLFERSEISALGTFSEKVKFFLYNTRTNNDPYSNQVVFKPYVDKYFELIFNSLYDSDQNIAGKEFTIADIQNAAKKELDKMNDGNNNAVFQSINGIYKRFFSPDPKDMSFFWIGQQRSADPQVQAFFDEHQKILNAIISAQKSVVQQDFIKSNNRGLSRTKSDGSTEFKNNLKDGLVNKLFTKFTTGNSTQYQLSKEAVKTFFSNGKYRLSNVEGGIQLNVGEKSIIIKEEHFTKSNDFADFRNDFLEQASSLFPSPSDLFGFLKAMGINISRDFFNHYIGVSQDKKQGNKFAEKRNLIDLGIHSYLIIAKQYLQEGKGSEFNDTSRSVINLAASRRDELISQIANEALRQNTLADTQEESEAEKPVFSPSTLYKKFEGIGRESTMIRYEKVPTLLHIMDGSKEIVDKYPTTMHRVLAQLTKIKVKNEAELEQVNNAREENPMSMFDFLKNKFPGLYSKMYRNPLIDGEMELGAPIYYKGTKNNKTNRSKSFQELTQAEFLTELFGMLMGDGLTGKYLHPMEIQADRGYMALVELGTNQPGRYRYHPVNVNGNWKPTIEGSNDLENIRRIAFHHAGTVMKEIYGILGDTAKVAEIDALVEGMRETEIKKAFGELDKVLKEKYAENKAITNYLTAKKHYIKTGDTISLSPLLMERMNISKKGFETLVEQEYLNFAEMVYDTYSDRSLAQEGKFYLDVKDVESVPQFKKLKNFTTEKKGKRYLSMFSDLRKNPEEYAKLDMQGKINSYHPALYSMFLTYYINQTHIAQRLTGDLYLYGFDKGTGPRLQHSYLTDNIKRQGTFTTPKIEGVFMERDQFGNVSNRKGMTTRIRLANIPDMEFRASVDSAEFRELYAKANPETVERMNAKGEPIEFKQETTDGSMFMSPIMHEQIQMSYGGEIGMNVGTMAKMNLHAFDPVKAEISLPKGLTQVITPQVLKNSTGHYLGMLKMMYRTAEIVSPDGSIQNLWDIYEQAIKEGSFESANQTVSELYFAARAGENGMSLKGDIVHLLTAESSNKGSRVGSNPYDENGQPTLEETVFTEVDATGFGVILDLQKDINKPDNDVTLSSQMVFLLGINGENHKKSTALYDLMSSMSSSQMDDILKDIARTIGGTEGASILKNQAAVKKWMAMEVKKSFAQKNDFGLIYQLVENFTEASISNPILFEEIFSKIGSVVSRAIVQKMNGFKAVQLPAHNFIFMYQDPNNGRWIMKEDAVRKGYDVENLRKKNLSYSAVAKGDANLTDTDVFTGNIFTGKYGIPEETTLDEIFALNIAGVEHTMEASYFQKIDGLQAFDPLVKAVESEQEVDWIASPIIQSMIQRNELNPELVEKLNSGGLTKEESITLFRAYKDRTVEMNKMLYGLMTRIPGTGKNSSSPTRIRGFVNGYKNVIFTPAEWFVISGSDNDGDTVQFWHYDKDKNNLNNQALNTSRGILKDVNNAMEIFSGIDLGFFNEKADIGKKQMVQEGKGYFHGSLKTLMQIRQNNATGAILTGIMATQAKVHSYAAIAKSVVLDLAKKLGEMDGKRKPRLERLFTKGMIQFNLVNGDSVIPMNQGALFANESGVYVDEKGQYVYKWNEQLTNGSIDNAKHLVMNFSNLNQFNSGFQQALTFFGASKQNIVGILGHPAIKAIYDKVAVLDNIANAYRGSAEKAIKEIYGTEILEELGLLHNRVNEANEEENAKETQTVLSYLNSKKFTIDLNNPKDVVALVMYMEEASKEINEIRKVIKVSESVPGKSAAQEMMLENLLAAVNMGFAGNNKLVDAKSLLDFLKSVNDKSKFDHVSRTKSKVKFNPLVSDRVMKALEKSTFIHPLAVLATVPHLREFAIRHLEFQVMKDGHLLSDPIIKGAKAELQGYLDFKQLRSERNRNQINKAIYKFVSGVYLEGFNNYAFDGKNFNLSSYAGKLEFRNYFRDFVARMKENTSNVFIDRLDVATDNVVYPGSEKLDAIGKVVPSEHFEQLDPKVKEAFLLYELTSADTHLQYKKGSFVTFMDGPTFSDYHAFLRNAEKGGVIFRSNEDVQSFIAGFAFENPNMLHQVNHFQVEGGDGKYGPIFHTKEIESQKYVFKKGEVRDIDLGHFNEERLNKVTEYQTKIDELIQSREEVRQEYNDIVSGEEILNQAQKEKLNKLADSVDKISNEIHKLEASISAALNRPVTQDGMTKYRLVRGYNAKKKEMYNKLYRIRKNPESGKVIMEQLMFKFDLNVSKYSRIASIPEITNQESIVTDKVELEKKIKEGKAKDGIYYGKNFEQYEVIEGKPAVNKFAFAKRVPTPAVKRKTKAIVAVIQKVFPGIKIQVVSGLTGEYAKVAGFVHQGTVYLNSDMMGLDVPMHEFGHIFIDLLEKTNPQLFAKIEAMVKKTALLSSISKKYEKYGNTDRDNVKEVFATMLGNYFKDNYASSMDGLTPKEIREFPELVKTFVSWIQDKIREIFTSLGIRKQYINDEIISDINLGTSLNSIFKVLGTAVIQGKVITDLTTAEINELERPASKRASDSEVQAIIDQMMINGQIKTYC